MAVMSVAPCACRIVLYCNRAACNMKVKNYDKCIKVGAHDNERFLSWPSNTSHVQLQDCDLALKSDRKVRLRQIRKCYTIASNPEMLGLGFRVRVKFCCCAVSKIWRSYRVISVDYTLPQ